MKTDLSMLSCRALDSNNNPYIESIAKRCISKNEKRSSLCGLDWKDNREKGLRQWTKVFMSQKKNLCIWVCEKKIAALKLLYSFLMHMKNLNLLFKKDFKSAELLTKTSFFLYFRDRPKNGEENQGDAESISAKVTKHALRKVANAEIKRNWQWKIDYALFWLYCIVLVVVISTDDWYQWPHWFHYFSISDSTCSKSTKGKLMGTLVRNGIRFFLLFGQKYYFMQKLSFLINNFFGNVVQISGVTLCKTRC